LVKSNGGRSYCASSSYWYRRQ